MKRNFYFPSPVEVVKVTQNNLQEVAEWCGGKVLQTESRRNPGTLDSYVWVPVPKSVRISWAFPGMFITKRVVITVRDEVRTSFAIFKKDYFSANYFDTPKDATDKTWERYFELNEAREKALGQEAVDETVEQAQAIISQEEAKIVEPGVEKG